MIATADLSFRGPDVLLPVRWGHCPQCRKPVHDVVRPGFHAVLARQGGRLFNCVGAEVSREEYLRGR